jgi:hypothetical protein
MRPKAGRVEIEYGHMTPCTLPAGVAGKGAIRGWARRAPGRASRGLLLFAYEAYETLQEFFETFADALVHELSRIVKDAGRSRHMHAAAGPETRAERAQHG